MVCRGCIHLPTPKHTHAHTTPSGTLTKDTLGTSSLLTNTPSRAIPVTDRELQHPKNAVLRGEERHTKHLRLLIALLLSAGGTPCVSLSTFCGYRDPRVTQVTPFFPSPCVD